MPVQQDGSSIIAGGGCSYGTQLSVGARALRRPSEPGEGRLMTTTPGNWGVSNPHLTKSIQADRATRAVWQRGECGLWEGPPASGTVPPSLQGCSSQSRGQCVSVQDAQRPPAATASTLRRPGSEHPSRLQSDPAPGCRWAHATHLGCPPLQESSAGFLGSRRFFCGFLDHTYPQKLLVTSKLSTFD